MRTAAGFCAVCGADLNVAPCDCEPVGVDPRWSGLDVLRAAGDEAGMAQEPGGP